MKNDKNSHQITPSGTTAQPQQTVPDNNHSNKYEVTLRWTQYNIAKVIIEAASLAEAEEKAEEIESDEIDDWNPVDGELYVDSVEPVSEGKSHE